MPNVAKAIELLEKDGWTQHVFGWDEGHCHCMMGALLLADKGKDWCRNANWEEFETVLDGLAQSIGFEHRHAAYDFNDSNPYRTKEEVISRLQQYI